MPLPPLPSTEHAEPLRFYSSERPGGVTAENQQNQMELLPELITPSKQTLEPEPPPAAYFCKCSTVTGERYRILQLFTPYCFIMGLPWLGGTRCPVARGGCSLAHVPGWSSPDQRCAGPSQRDPLGSLEHGRRRHTQAVVPLAASDSSPDCAPCLAITDSNASSRSR